MGPRGKTWGLVWVFVGALALKGWAAEPAHIRPMPGPPPWLPQYDLNIHLDVAGHSARVHQRVAWTNRQQRPTQEIVFNAHSHYKVPDKDIGLVAKTLEMLRMNPDEGIYGGREPLEIHKICLGEQNLAFRYGGEVGTDLVVSLPIPVECQQTVILDLDFTFHLPQKQGRWGQWQGVTFLSNWLPVVAVYDEQGWQPRPFVPWHQPFFNEAGSYKVRVVLPDDQKIACSGTVQAVRTLGKGQKEVEITAPGVRDFSLVCSHRFVDFSGQAATPGLPPIQIHCLAFPEHEHYAREIVRMASEVLSYYSALFGPYPYPQLTYVESYFGWNGNECSNLIMVDERVLAMPHVGRGYVEYLIAHETCHQWWYNLIGTDGYRETWLDEGMATYFAHRYLTHKNGANNNLLHFPRGLGWLPNIPRDSYRYAGLYGTLGRGEETPPIQELPKFGHVATLFSICYDKGGKIVGMIEDRLGETAFLDFLHRIYDRYAFGILRVSELQRELEEYTGKEHAGTTWADFFGRWLYGAGLCDWSIEKVKIETLEPFRPSPPDTADFLSALHARKKRSRPCKVTVLLHQKADYDEPTVLGFCLRKDKQDGSTPFQVRVPILPQGNRYALEDYQTRVEILPGHRVSVEVVLPCRPVQIAVDPEGILVDRDPANNFWKPPTRRRLTPFYTLLDDTDLTTAHDRWNATLGPWVYLATYNDPWYPRSTMAGVRAGLYRTQQFNGGIYAGYRTSYEDVVVGMDGLWDHCPWPNTQLGFNAERRLATAIQGEISPSRGVLFGRYVFQYNSSLYLPPMHYLEAFTTAEENFLPYNRNPVPGSQRFEHMVVGGLHYHINYLTPYWDPQGGFQFDLTYSGGEVKLDRNVGLHQLTGQFSTVKSMPDLSEYLGEENPAGKVLHWFGQTRLAVRAFGAGGIPDRGEYFALGGDPLFRGFSMKERQGSLVWLGSLEWRLPLARHLTWSCIDRVVGVRNLWGAVFYDVGDAYTRGQSAGPVAHALGAGLRIDVTWFGFVERSSLRFDLAKAVNLETPCQFWFGVNMPF